MAGQRQMGSAGRCRCGLRVASPAEGATSARQTPPPQAVEGNVAVVTWLAVKLNLAFHGPQSLLLNLPPHQELTND